RRPRRRRRRGDRHRRHPRHSPLRERPGPPAERVVARFARRLVAARRRAATAGRRGRHARRPLLTVRRLADDALYTRIDACRAHLAAPPRRPPRPGRVLHHAYWHGPFGAKPALALKSCLATQSRADVWLWLDADAGFVGHEADPHLAALGRRI